MGVRMFRRREGDWTPAHLTRRDCTVLVSAICAIALLRAGDYLTGVDAFPPPGGPPAPTPISVALSDVFPLWAWGLAIAAGVLLLCGGAFFRRHVAVYLGHGWLMATYLTLFVGTIIPLLSRPWWDGYRGATALLAPVVIHFLFWLRTGPRPLTSGETVPTETVRGPE